MSPYEIISWIVEVLTNPVIISVVERILFYLGLVLVTVGAVCDLIASIGLLRFPNFYVRMHAATIGTIGGAVIPLIGVGMIALASTQLGWYRFPIAFISIATAFTIMIVAPTGVHALAYAAHKARVVPVEPKVIDMLEIYERGGRQ